MTTTVDAGDLFDTNDINARVALTWQQQGCAIVPWAYEVRGARRRKVPAFKGWTNGSALTTEHQVREWFRDHPHYPGIVTGAASQLWVLDLDGPEGLETFRQLLIEHGHVDGRLPEGHLKVKTPSGGWHVYFAWEEGIHNSVRALGPGVDVRGEGGYVAAPGAKVLGGRYEVLNNELYWPLLPAPAWLVELVRSRPASRDWEALGGSPVTTAEELAAAAPGEQEHALFRYLGAQHRRGVAPAAALEAAWDVVRTWPLGDPDDPWTYEDVQAKVRHTWAREEFFGVAAPELAPEHRSFIQRYRENAELALGNAFVVEEPTVPPSPEVQAEAEHRATLVLGTLPEGNHDRANGRALALFAEDRLRILAGTKDDWLVWTGKRWEPDDRFGRFALVEQLGVALLQQATNAVDEERQVLVKRSQRLMMVGGRDAALNYARDLLAITRDELDPDHDVLNCRNGLLDLRTGRLRPARPEDLVTKLVDLDYRPDRTDPVWERVLAELLTEDDAAWLQKWFGYCLTGDTSEKAICCLHGPPDSGKSTISESFRLTLGDTAAGGYSQTWESEVFEARSAVNKAEKVSGLDNARLVVGSELAEGVRMNSAFVKAITGGEAIGGRALFKKSGSYKPRLKLMMHTNHIPRSGDVALQKRLRFVYLDRQLTHDEKDPAVIKHLQGPGPEEQRAREAILAWAVEGCLRWRREGLGMPARQEEELARFRRESDHVVEFVEDALVTGSEDPAEWPDKAALRAAYEGWCHEQGYTPVRPMTLKQGLENQGLEFARTVRGGAQAQLWQGVKIVWRTDLATLSERAATVGDEV